MQLVNEAGIETRLRRIWTDREFVAEDVSDENLCAWLESKRTMGSGERTLHHGNGIVNLAFSPDGTTLATVGWVTGEDERQCGRSSRQPARPR